MVKLTHLLRIYNLDQTDPVGGGVNLEERMLLYAIIAVVKPGTVLEIGVSNGRSTSWIAAALADIGAGKLLGIDKWGSEAGGKAEGPQTARERLHKAGIASYARIQTANSHEWLRKRKARSFDLVWVDGDHTRDGAEQDIREALRIARRLVIVHDTKLLPQVRKAVKAVVGDAGTFIDGARGFWIGAPE